MLYVWHWPLWRFIIIQIYIYTTVHVVFIIVFLCYRKRVLDFYQRACLSGYCSAFAYKPMQVSLSSQLNGKCVELAPGPCLFSGVELPSTTPIKHNSCRNSWSSDGTRGDAATTVVHQINHISNTLTFLFPFPHRVSRGYRWGGGAWGLCPGLERTDLHGHGVISVPGQTGHGPSHWRPGHRLHPLCLLLYGGRAPQQGEHTRSYTNILQSVARIGHSFPLNGKPRKSSRRQEPF